MSEALQTLFAMAKGSTATSSTTLRVNIVKCLSGVVIGGGVKIQDLYVEITKMATKLAADKLSSEVREQAALLVKEMSKQPICTISTYESLSAILTMRGGLLEDDNAAAQDAAAQALASIYGEVQL